MNSRNVVVAGLLLVGTPSTGALAEGGTVLPESQVKTIKPSQVQDQVAVRATGLIAALLPPISPLPLFLPIALPDPPAVILPHGLIPNFSLELPFLSALQNLALPPLPVPNNPESNTIANCGPQVDLRKGAVFTELNLLPNNQVLVYARNTNGTLCEAGIFNTGGTSTLPFLVSGQDAVIANGGYLFVINQGSANGPLGDGSISVLRIESDRLVVVDEESSGGPNPLSATRHGDLVYVVNGGLGLGLLGPNLSLIPETIQGYRFDENTGNLNPMPGSQYRTLDPFGSPAQIGFSPDGNSLVITQRRDTFGAGSGAEPTFIEIVTLNDAGLPVRINRQDVVVNAPFGFRFDAQGRLFLTNANFTFANSSAVSAYQIQPDGSLTVLTPPAPDGGSGTCWNYISQTTEIPHLYTSAFFDSQVGNWAINPDGSIRLINGQAASSADTEGFQYIVDEGGLDMQGTVDATTGNEYLYVLNISDFVPLGLRTGRIVGFQIMPDGDLHKMGRELIRGIPNTVFGLWAL